MRRLVPFVAVVLGLGGCAPASSAAPEAAPSVVATSAPASPAPSIVPTQPTATASPTPSAIGPATFLSVVDGDTIETSAGTVRLMGVDTPELGECGHDDASIAIGRILSPGDEVTLELTDGQNDRDDYGRLIRYVTTADGVDLGLLQLEAGNALARYDSTDGRPAHPREAAYHAAQLATPGPDRSVVTLACQAPTETPTAPADAAAPSQTIAPETSDPWWMKYSSCTKLKKNTVGDPTGPFSVDDPAQVEIYNWFAYGTGNRGDGDGDGLACE